MCLISLQEFNSLSFLYALSFPSPYVDETVSHSETACANGRHFRISERNCSAISLTERQPFFVSMIIFLWISPSKWCNNAVKTYVFFCFNQRLFHYKYVCIWHLFYQLRASERTNLSIAAGQKVFCGIGRFQSTFTSTDAKKIFPTFMSRTFCRFSCMPVEQNTNLIDVSFVLS